MSWRRAFYFFFLIAAGIVFSSVMAGQQQPDPNGVYKVGSGVTAPKPISMPNPEYTDRARRKKIRGTVMVSFVVAEDGSVRDARVTKSLDKDLDHQAVDAVMRWKFQPAMKDGQPVAVHVDSEVTFNIR